MSAFQPRVLIVDDEPLNIDMLSKRLARHGYIIEPALSADEGWQKIAENPPDIVLLDVFMPHVSGFDLLARLRANERTRSIPVILVSAHADSDSVVEGLQKGANDYVTKPVNLQVLLARLETHLKMAEMVKRLEEQKEMLARLAAVDELTGLFNRRVMFEQLEQELRRSRRYGEHVSVMMLDLDHFKQVNDVHGHAAGDTVLKNFASKFLNTMRETDLACRYGGEEFCAILPETTLEHALRAAEHIRADIAGHAFFHEGIEINVTVSIGVSSYCPEHKCSGSDLIGYADRALYEAKRKGRNQVRAFTEFETQQI